MREIKFRAWVPIKKTLCEVLIIDYKEKAVQLPIETEVNASYWWDETKWSFKDINLMQYTGLKGKNGVEIYEGDVVQDSTEQNYVVAYDEERAAFILIWCSNDDRFETFEYQKTLKVIGNIYENPELAEDVSL